MGRITNLIAYALLVVVSLTLAMTLRNEANLQQEVARKDLKLGDALSEVNAYRNELGETLVKNKVAQMDFYEMRDAKYHLEQVVIAQRRIIALSRKTLKQWNIQNNIDFDGAENPTRALTPKPDDPEECKP